MEIEIRQQLTDNNQTSKHLDKILAAQKQLTRLELTGIDEETLLLTNLTLTNNKRKLSEQLISHEKINQLCQLQKEVIQLEKQLKQATAQQEQKMEAFQVELASNN